MERNTESDYLLRPVQSTADYVAAFEQVQQVEIAEASGMRGRILRGKAESPGDFDNLGLPGRELAFLMGPDGLAELPGLPLPLALGRIGLMPDYVAGRISQGYSFKLAVFKGGPESRLATWDNALDLIADWHPLIKPDIEVHRQTLKTTPPQEFIHRMLPEDFDQIELAGPSHPSFMDTRRYLEVPQHLRCTDALYLRRWLMHVEHIGIVFRGDGYTQTPSGERGVKEYLVPNSPLADPQDVVLLDLS